MKLLQRISARWRDLADWQSDLVLALALFGVDVLAQFIIRPEDVTEFDYAGPSAITIALALVANLPVALRRRYPEVTTAVAGGSLIAAGPFAVPLMGFSLLVGLYTVAALRCRREALQVLAICIGGALVALAMLGEIRYLPLTVVTLFAAWALGDRQQARRAYTDSLQERAADLERRQEDQARLAVADERARIARELHDVIAHSVSVMTVQAIAGRRTLHTRPERAEEALAQIEATGRQSLLELRRLLGLVRDSQGQPALHPQPGLAEVEQLARQFRESGMPVDVQVSGRRRPLPAGVELSAYRIVQEALTNTLKHAGTAAATVRVVYDADSLRLEIADNGVGPPSADMNGSGGHGLVGMRERAALVGGTLASGPRPGGGFKVTAALPTADAE